MLRGMELPIPRFSIGPLSNDLLHVKGYKNLQTFFPTLTKLFRLGRWSSGEDEIWPDQQWKVVSIDCSGTAGPCFIGGQAKGDTAEPPTVKPAYLKATHLLDPIHWIRGAYSLPKESGLPWHHKAWQRAWLKLQDPGNHAYIETVASYVLGRLREDDISPHFNIFYGAFCARADTYRYNLTEDFQSYRHERWFWKGYNKKLFTFHVVNENDPTVPVPQEIMDEILNQLDNDGELSATSESLPDIDIGEEVAEASIKSNDSMGDISFTKSKSSRSGSSATSGSGSDSESSEGEEYTIYADIPNYPVMMILTEQNEGTMDSLFESMLEVGAIIGTPAWEMKWTAWLFQIIAGLSCIQTVLGFTHNDLHTNNIVWSKTSDEFIYYKTRAGSVFKVPTYGKVFRIIDFGRSIFTVNKQMFISDDFKVGSDAEGQYEFVPLVQKVKNEVLPNPSFDLCRLAVSMIDGIFPKIPGKKENGAVLSKEPRLTIVETVSPLYNMIWLWMIDDNGRNIFVNPDGSERFPTFNLYKHIASSCHGAVPYQQIMNKVFDDFQIVQSDVPVGTKVYSLFA